MLAALLCNAGPFRTADGDYRKPAAFRRKKWPKEVVADALQAQPELARDILAPFFVGGADTLVDFRRLLGDLVAYEQLQAILRQQEEEEMAMILAML